MAIIIDRNNNDSNPHTVIVSFSSVDGVVGIARIFKFHECERRSALILQINKRDLAELVEEIFDVLGANIGREVADVDPAIAASTRRHG